MKIFIQPYMYGSVKACDSDKNHLSNVDADGYCKLCGFDDSPENLLKDEVKDWMLMALDTDSATYVDVDNKCFNITRLAKNAAFSFNSEAWLNDEKHFVWDLAVEAVKEYKK